METSYLKCPTKQLCDLKLELGRTIFVIGERKKYKNVLHFPYDYLCIIYLCI